MGSVNSRWGVPFHKFSPLRLALFTSLWLNEPGARGRALPDHCTNYSMLPDDGRNGQCSTRLVRQSARNKA
eukprot:2157255-Prymnesium_polylepis.1